uniref:ATP-dependent DNA helicase n=1 Tax=Lactuca sativa TaxID=4236 RepID=A0A9R1UHW8_LACSA|nr:hypothetical protein LSAT_V11C900480530 [Lactuca sativa]
MTFIIEHCLSKGCHFTLNTNSLLSLKHTNKLLKLFLNPLSLLLNLWPGRNVPSMKQMHISYHMLNSLTRYVDKDKKKNKGQDIWLNKSRVSQILLNKIKGLTFYEDIRTVNRTIYESYKDICYAFGLLHDDRELVLLSEGFFVMLITSDSLSRPDHVFKESYKCLLDDVIHVHEKEIGVTGLKLKPDAIFNITLSYIEKSLLSCGVSLKQIPNMPFPDHRYIQESYNMLIQESYNMLIQDELNFDPPILEVEHQDLHSELNVEQKNVYETIVNVVNNKQGHVFFLYRYGGTGKTFVWKTLFVAI